MIGGFLGAGKTTLLNRLLRAANGERIAVLVNDFGSLNIDADLVVAHGGETIALANGCICCSIGDSLTDTLIALLQRPDRYDRIVVEASGVANPARIADIALLDPDLVLDGVVVLVDASAIREQAVDRFVGETVLMQLAAADILILNKVDTAAGDLGLADWLDRVAPGIPTLRCTYADVPLPLLVGRLDRERGSSHVHADFQTVSLNSDATLDRVSFDAAVGGLPSAVLRAKGTVRFMDGTSALLQKTGRRHTLTPLRTAAETAVRLLFIGTPEMPDETALRRELGLPASPVARPRSGPLRASGDRQSRLSDQRRDQHDDGDVEGRMRVPEADGERDDRAPEHLDGAV